MWTVSITKSEIKIVAASCFKLFVFFLIISSFFWGRPESQEDLIFIGGGNTQTMKTQKPQSKQTNKQTKPYHPPQKSRRNQNYEVLLRMEVFTSRISTVWINALSLDLKATKKQTKNTSNPTKNLNLKTNKWKKPLKVQYQEFLYFCITQAQLCLGNLNLIAWDDTDIKRETIFSRLF